MKLSVGFVAFAFASYFLKPEVVLQSQIEAQDFVGKCVDTETNQVFVIGKCFDRGKFKKCPDTFNDSEMEMFDGMFSERSKLWYKVKSKVYTDNSSWNTPPGDFRNFENAKTRECPADSGASTSRPVSRLQIILPNGSQYVVDKNSVDFVKFLKSKGIKFSSNSEDK